MSIKSVQIRIDLCSMLLVTARQLWNRESFRGKKIKAISVGFYFCAREMIGLLFRICYTNPLVTKHTD